MKYDPLKHHRRSIRLKGYDYRLAGAYFVTLVTWKKECLFGEIVNGEMHLNRFGHLVEDEWQRMGNRIGWVVVEEMVVMPNHLHGILVIVDNGTITRQDATRKKPGGVAGSLGAVVGVYKSTTTRMINTIRNSRGASVWQRNFYEHIIRDEGQWDAVRAYIQTNPLNWEQDREYH